MEAHWAAWRGNPDALRDALDHMCKKPRDRDDVMSAAVGSTSLDCVKVLYDKGYEQCRSKHASTHPAVIAVRYRQLDVLRFVVDRIGPPQAEAVCCAHGVEGGMKMMHYVRGLRCLFDERATETAARRGDLEALRYLHMSKAPWDSWTLVAALRADSLPCLHIQYAHMHGFPHDVKTWRFHQMRADSLPVVRYASTWIPHLLLKRWSTYCVHCKGPCWSGDLLSRLAIRPMDGIAGVARGDVPRAEAGGGLARSSRIGEGHLDGTGRTALAGVFWKAGKYQRA
jgi:hypothetical protein